MRLFESRWATRLRAEWAIRLGQALALPARARLRGELPCAGANWGANWSLPAQATRR
jgi:hypothetical protein